MCVKRYMKLREIINRLIGFYGYSVNPNEFIAVKALREGLHPFGALVAIILSQNTSDINALRALRNLMSRLGPKLEPKAFTKVSVDELADLIKPSGMYRIKARTILNALRKVGLTEVLTKEDPEKLREILISIQGIGYKTADVFLLMVRGYPTFPIDTHIRRILYRLGFIEKNESYESIRAKVMRELPRNMYLHAHLVLIRHGRSICKAKKPLCSKCPLRDICPRRIS